MLITFITIPTILLSANHVHEIGILALQVDESIVMKLMMGSSKKGMRGLYKERIGVAAHPIGSIASLWHKWLRKGVTTRMVCLVDSA
jgi:hypothetical protein